MELRPRALACAPLPVAPVALAALVALSAAPARAQAQCLFPQSARSNTNNGGLRIRAADFNGDGGIDFAMGGFDAGFYLALRSSTGTYPAVLPLVSMPAMTESIAVGDVDGDLDQDVLAGGFPIALRRGNGDGTFQAPVQLPGAPNVKSVELFDLDQDGDLDAAMPVEIPAGIFLSRNDGAGNFVPWNSIAIAGAGRPSELTCGQFDADLVPDIVLARQGTSAVFLRGLGGGSFATPTAISPSTAFTTQAACADLDADGDLDLVLSSTSTVTILLGDGQGNFTTVVSEETGNNPLDFALADFDRDGRLDVAATGNYGQVAILENQGGGLFAPRRLFSGGEQSWAVAAGDINLDGVPDLACVDLGGMVYLQGDGRGGLRTPEHLRAGDLPGFSALPAVQAVRLDADAFEDVVYAVEGPAVVTRLSDGRGAFGATLTSPAPFPAMDLLRGHVDVDGLTDLWLATGGAQIVGTLRGTGTGAFVQPSSTPTAFPFRSFAAGELTGDAFEDLVIGEYTFVPPNPNPVGTRLHVLPGDGNGGFGTPIQFASGGAVTKVLVGDLDGQFDEDFVALGASVPALLGLSQGGGVFSVQTLSAVPAGGDGQLFDVDGDTHLDIVHFGSGVTVFTGDGLGGFTPHPTSPHFLAGPLTLADFDADGTVDIVALDKQLNDLVVLLGNGAGGFALNCRAYSGSTRTDSLAAIDLENDGMPDVVVAHHGTLSGLTVHANQLVAGVPHAYCTAKVNSLGCVPSVLSAGSPSASAASGFTVSCTQSRNNKPGLMLYSVLGRAALPFSGGTLCLGAPIRRTPGLHSGGSPAGSDCSGVFSIDMNAFARGSLGGTPAPSLSCVGTVVDCQFWGRDPGYPPPNDTQLSNGLEYVVGP
jgi:hypothetical protein